jgi:hypothetical protein
LGSAAFVSVWRLSKRMLGASHEAKMDNTPQKPTHPVKKVAREELRVWLFVVIPIVMALWVFGGRP